MSELVVGSLKGLSSKSFVIDVASGSKLVQPGSILQVANAIKTDTQSSSIALGGTAAISGLSVTLTPTSNSSKFLIMGSVVGGNNTTPVYGGLALRLVRNSTAIALGATSGSRTPVTSSQLTVVSDQVNHSNLTFNVLDSPATSSAVTYSVELVNAVHVNSTITFYVNRNDFDPDGARNARAVSTLTVMEVAG